jgi:hypothetical protein
MDAKILEMRQDPPPPPPPPLPDYPVPPEVAILDTRERRFVEYAILDGLPLERAAIEAGYCPNYSTRLRRRPKIMAAIRALRIPDSERLIASVAQLRERLSRTALDEETKDSDRNQATALLLKVEGALGPETFVDARVQSVAIHIGAEAPEALLDVLDALARLADGETIPAEEAGRILAAYTEQTISTERLIENRQGQANEALRIGGS